MDRAKILHHICLFSMGCSADKHLQPAELQHNHGWFGQTIQLVLTSANSGDCCDMQALKLF